MFKYRQSCMPLPPDFVAYNYRTLRLWLVLELRHAWWPTCCSCGHCGSSWGNHKNVSIILMLCFFGMASVDSVYLAIFLLFPVSGNCDGYFCTTGGSGNGYGWSMGSVGWAAPKLTTKSNSFSLFKILLWLFFDWIALANI